MRYNSFRKHSAGDFDGISFSRRLLENWNVFRLLQHTSFVLDLTIDRSVDVDLLINCATKGVAESAVALGEDADCSHGWHCLLVGLVVQHVVCS